MDAGKDGKDGQAAADAGDAEIHLQQRQINQDAGRKWANGAKDGLLCQVLTGHRNLL